MEEKQSKHEICKKMPKKLFKIIMIILIIFMIFVTIKLILLPKVTYQIQEAIMNSTTNEIDYIIVSKYTSRGAIVANNKVNVEIEIISVKGRDFQDLNEVDIYIGGAEKMDIVYALPIKKSQSGLIVGAMIQKDSIKMSEDNKKISGKISSEFSIPGDYPIYLIHIKYNDGVEYIWPSSKKIIIELPSVLVQLETYRFSLIALVMPIIILFLELMKDKINNKQTRDL